MKRVVVVGGIPESLTNFRGALIKRLIENGFRVIAMSSPAINLQIEKIKALGASFEDFPLERNGLRPWKDIQTWWVLRKKFTDIRPDIVLAYTIKPVIWGGLALFGKNNFQFYALITGLGFAFQGKDIRRRLLQFIVSGLYRFSLSRASGVIFQNRDDLEKFVSLKIVPRNKCHIVRGSGVDITHFSLVESYENRPTFITIARLLNEKGLRVYAKAASKVKQKYPDAIFRLLGSPDPSPDGIPMAEVMQWDKDGTVEYLGETDDVRPHLAACHVFVLASYYGEGLPRTIIEAMAMGKPILTTDNVGCRETVVAGENGFLVPIKDSDALAERMIWFIEHQEELRRMSMSSRNLAVEWFDVNKVNSQMFQIMGLSS